MPRLTEVQLAARRSRLGASDVAVIAGVSPWKTPFELYLEKIGELDPIARTSSGDLARQERGHRLEDVALDWDAELRGHRLTRVRMDVQHARLPFIVVHPDARMLPWASSRRLIEAKTSARKWDEVPQHVEAQVQMQMSAANADFVDVVVLGFDGPPAVFEVVRNQELIDGLEELAVAFWDRVARRDPPPLDGSTAASRWLDRLFREGPEQVADPSQADAVRRLLEVRATVKALEAEDSRLVNALKFSMAGGSRLYAPKVGKVNWTTPFARRDVAWKDVADEYRAELVALRLLLERHDLGLEFPTDAQLDELVARHTTTTDGIRQFRVTAAKANEEAA